MSVQIRVDRLIMTEGAGWIRYKLDGKLVMKFDNAVITSFIVINIIDNVYVLETCWVIHLISCPTNIDVSIV